MEIRIYWDGLTCPLCGREVQINSEQTELYCACGFRYVMGTSFFIDPKYP